ncbi:MAG: hypothetical protein JXM70_14635, partial [Pirellulales bacterium]|nr:hypothetical protein [Pirellulales bacterium]
DFCKIASQGHLDINWRRSRQIISKRCRDVNLLSVNKSVSQDNVKETFASQSFLLHVPLIRNFAKVQILHEKKEAACRHCSFPAEPYTTGVDCTVR